MVLRNEPQLRGGVESGDAVLLRAYKLEDIGMNIGPVTAATFHEIVEITLGQPRLMVLQRKHLRNSLQFDGNCIHL